MRRGTIRLAFAALLAALSFGAAAQTMPDFRALSRKSQQMIDDTRPLFVEAGREWQKLYAILDPKQLDAVRQFLRENGGSLLAPAK